MARFIGHAWRAAAMDSVRAAGRITPKELVYVFEAFGGVEGSEPPFMLNCAVYAEITDEAEWIEIEGINRYVTGGPRELAVMKMAAEKEVERKLVARTRKEQCKKAWEVARLKNSRLLESQQEKLGKARNGERALTNAEIEAMQGMYGGPRMATVSYRLR